MNESVTELESSLDGLGVGWLANLAPMTYFDANAILLDGSYDLARTGILLVATLVLVAVSQLRFTRMDIQ